MQMGEAVGGMARRWEGTAAEQAASHHQPCPQSPWQPSGAAWLSSQTDTLHLLGGRMCPVVEICLLISTRHQVIDQLRYTSRVTECHSHLVMSLAARRARFYPFPYPGTAAVPAEHGFFGLLAYTSLYGVWVAELWFLTHAKPLCEVWTKSMHPSMGAVVVLAVGHKVRATPQQGLPALCLSLGISIFAAFSVIMSKAGEQAEGVWKVVAGFPPFHGWVPFAFLICFALN